MRRVPTLAVAVTGLLTIAASTAAGEDNDLADIVAARKFSQPVMGQTCTFGNDEKGAPDGDNNVFHLTYRTAGQDQDSPDRKRTLVQLSCSAGAYNLNSIFLLRDDDDGGGWEILSFAEPRTDFDYVDEEFSRLKAPPKVSGYVAVTQLTNSEYDAGTKTITANAKWRGIGDAWSAGEWEFSDGVFVLKRYEIDPTFQGAGAQQPDPGVPQSYVVFGDPSPAEVRE